MSRFRRYISLPRLLVVLLATTFYTFPLSSLAGVVSAIGAAAVALPMAQWATDRRLRISSAALGSAGALALLLWLADGLVDWRWFVSTIPFPLAVHIADSITFASVAFFAVFLIRLVSLRYRVFALAEALIVIASVVPLLSSHRNQMIHRPRFLSDWAWSHGINPSHVLLAIGMLMGMVSLFFLLRKESKFKVWRSLVFIFLVVSITLVTQKKGCHDSRSADPLGLSRGGEKAKNTDASLFKDNYEHPNSKRPVAVAILRDELRASGSDMPPVLYFRQRVLSAYNGANLTGSPKYDQDVFIDFPGPGRSVRARPFQRAEAHRLLPTTMYLIVDHPQPLALSHAESLTLVENPNPQHFVAAYDVSSQRLALSFSRLVGRVSVPKSWTAARRKHYTTLPSDPRYQALADIIVRTIDPRFAHDDITKAIAIKRYLERNGFYTRRSHHRDVKDPAASFLFGSLRGYCVHFAHAAVYLLRTQGIAARVALGYAVPTRQHQGGSAIVIVGDRAHAWPEIHLDGIGWVTFDVYPERSDLQPTAPVDFDLEKILGELARGDKSAGKHPAAASVPLPWRGALFGTFALLGLIYSIGFVIKGIRQLRASCGGGSARAWRWAYVALLDRLSELALHRDRGEIRERHARRVCTIAPHMPALTAAYVAHMLGAKRHSGDHESFAQLITQVEREIRDNIPRWRRIVGRLNAFSWRRTR